MYVLEYIYAWNTCTTSDKTYLHLHTQFRTILAKTLKSEAIVHHLPLFARRLRKLASYTFKVKFFMSVISLCE